MVSVSLPAQRRRNRVWRHNSFIGHAVLMRANLNAIISADSTTEHTKHLARTILGLIPALQNSLTERVDPKGTSK